MSAFFAMGGYAWYVWMSYGAVVLAILIEVGAVRARRKRALQELRMSAHAGTPSTLGARRSR